MGTAIAKAEITISRIIDIAGTTRYYLLQSSTASAPSVPADNPPGGNWVTTEPTYTTGSTNTLYFVDLTEFTNDTYKYSEVSKSSSYEAAKAAYNKAVAAQNTANSAQKDVDDLGDDVASIETRVLNAETQIEKNNEAISLTATKTEVTEAKNAAIADTDNKLKNYSTTAEMDSALTVKANEITSHVSATYTTKDEFNTRVSSAETRITQTEKDIQLRATTEEMNAAIKVAADGINSEVESLKTKVTWVTDVWVDATAYDQSLWIPFKGNGLPLEHSARISVTAALNNNCHPSWATHGSGFSVEFEVEDIGNGWGVNTWNQRILADKFNWCNTSPVSYTQLGYGSIPVLYLRGGGKYRVMTSYECNWTGYPDGYTWTSGEYSQSAPTHTSRPTPSGTNLYSDMAEAKSKISQQADSITGVVAKANKNESDIASLKLTSDSFTVRFDTVEGNVDDAIDKATQAQESFDNLEVGGRNYLTNAKRLNNWLHIIAGTSYDTSHAECPNGVYMVGIRDESSQLRLSNVITGNGYWTVSFEIKGSQSTAVGFHIDICDLGRAMIRCNTKNTWEKRSLTVNVTNYSSDIYHFVDFENISWAYIFIRNIKIEKGSKATDWTPAPEDVDSAISTAQSTANTAKSNAAAAQSTANDATTLANNAQADADAARTAANNAQNDIDNLSIGGRNLVHNSNIFTHYGGATGITGSVTSEGYLRIVASSGNGNWYNFAVGTIDTGELKQGDTFTLSFTMRSPDATKIPTIYLASGMGYWGMNGALSSEWSTIWCTQTWKSGLTINWHLGFSGCVGTYEIKNVKIEKGNRPTDWSPSPTNYMTFKKNVGLIIGNLTSGVDDLSKIGQNVRIDSDSVDICLGEAILASYRDNEILLGMNSPLSVIDLCDGTGQITSSALSSGTDWWRLEMKSQNSIGLTTEGEITMDTWHSRGNESTSGIFRLVSAEPWHDNVAPYGKFEIAYTNGPILEKCGMELDFGTLKLYTDTQDIDVWNPRSLQLDQNGVTTDSDLIFSTNNSRIWGTETNGTQVEVFQAKNSSNNTVIGWGNYSNASGNTNIYGNDIYFNSAAAVNDKAYRPYYRAGDTITVDLDTAGFVTSSARSVRFVVPLSKPIIGNPVITATSVNGITLRQGGQYTHGSSATTYAAVNSYSVSTTNGGNHVVVQAQINTTTNAVNNESIGIRWSGKLTLSSSTQNVG